MESLHSVRIEYMEILHPRRIKYMEIHGDFNRKED